MEVKMAMCPNGHYYNSAIHATCPQCGKKGSEIQHTVPAGPETVINRTMPANNANNTSNIGKTVAADTASSGGETIFPGANGKTIPVTPDDAPGRFGPTVVGEDIGDAVVEPVVGWLVCIDGPVKGCDFRIHAGYNYIGRETGDIRIAADMRISHENHAMVAYDPEDCGYYFGPSGGRNLVKLNGKTVLNAVEIHDYDVISIGSSKLMFIGVCGDSFSWEKGVTGGNGR